MKVKIVSKMTTLFSTSKNKTRKIRHKRIKFNYINEKKKENQCSLSIDRSIVTFSYETTIHERKDVTGGR